MNMTAILANALATNASLAVQDAIRDRTPEALHDALAALADLVDMLQAWQTEVTP